MGEPAGNIFYLILKINGIRYYITFFHLFFDLFSRFKMNEIILLQLNLISILSF